MRSVAVIAFAVASLMSTVASRADGPGCMAPIERMSILQGFAKKGTEDQAKLKTYSMSELQLDPTPLCTVLVDNIDMWQEMLTEAQMCEGDPVMGSPKSRENAANMVIMYRQQLSQLPCHR